jgi:hypothetical protein
VEGQFNYGNDPSMQRGAFGIQRKKNLGSAKFAHIAYTFHRKLIAIVQFVCSEMWVLIIRSVENSPSSSIGDSHWKDVA